MKAESPARGLLEARGTNFERLRGAVAANSPVPAPHEGAPPFTPEAERAMALAAGDDGSPVDALSLLIVLAREESGRALELLAAAGADVDGLAEAAAAAREAALAAAPALDAAPERAIRMAFAEGREVDGGDLLLALVEHDRLSRAALAELGISPQRLREVVQRVRDA